MLSVDHRLVLLRAAEEPRTKVEIGEILDTNSRLLIHRVTGHLSARNYLRFDGNSYITTPAGLLALQEHDTLEERARASEATDGHGPTAVEPSR